MESISNSTITPPNTTAKLRNQGTEPESEAKETPEGASDFEAYMRANLTAGASGQVSEEELFAGVMGERVNSRKGEEAAKAYRDALQSNRDLMRFADGYVPHEDAAKAALRSLVDAGTLTKEEGDTIYAESFAAAQLDSNVSALYDDRGGPDDPTMAVEALEAALLSARVKIEGLGSGVETLTTRELIEPTLTKSQIMSSLGYGALVTDPLGGIPTGDFGGALSSTLVHSGGTIVDGDGGFLYKPVSNDGRLSVLSPDNIGPDVQSISLYDTLGNFLEAGRFTSFGDDGRNRAKFAFSQPGGSYPKELLVEILYKDGTAQRYQIGDSSQRHD